MGALISGIDEVDDTVADWEASREAGGFLSVRRRNERSCLAEQTKTNAKYKLSIKSSEGLTVANSDGFLWYLCSCLLELLSLKTLIQTEPFTFIFNTLA